MSRHRGVSALVRESREIEADDEGEDVGAIGEADASFSLLSSSSFSLLGYFTERAHLAGLERGAEELCVEEVRQGLHVQTQQLSQEEEEELRRSARRLGFSAEEVAREMLVRQQGAGGVSRSSSTGSTISGSSSKVVIPIMMKKGKGKGKGVAMQQPQQQQQKQQQQPKKNKVVTLEHMPPAQRMAREISSGKKPLPVPISRQGSASSTTSSSSKIVEFGKTMPKVAKASPQVVPVVALDFPPDTSFEVASQGEPSKFARAFVTSEADNSSNLTSVSIPNFEQEIQNLKTRNGTVTEEFDFVKPSPDDVAAAARAGRMNREEPVLRIAPDKKAADTEKEPPASATTPPAPTPTGSRQKLNEEEINAIIATKKPLLNLVVVGHVDAGKSTLMGHLLFKLGLVSKKEIYKYEKESRELGKASFHFAWVMDEQGEERSRGVTMDVGVNRFETANKRVLLLDAPGHRDYIPRMITGAAQADSAILVVPASTGEFESSCIKENSQTREHALLVRCLGVTQIIVAVNKMDSIHWDEGRFEFIERELTDILTKFGFEKDEIRFVPVSGLEGINLVTDASNKNGVPQMPWYKGPSLLDAVDTFEARNRPVSKPFRMVVSDVYKSMDQGITLGGKIESGYCSVGDKVLVSPNNEIISIKSIQNHKVFEKHAFAGENAELGVGVDDIGTLFAGNILCSANAPIPISNKFEARVTTFSTLKTPIMPGSQFSLHVQSVEVTITIQALVQLLPYATGGAIKMNPRCIRQNETAILRIACSKPICVEKFDDFRPLGRFFLRSSGVTIAFGMVTEIL